MSRPDGFILAGGKSRRMGRDKALIELEGRPLLGRVLDAMRPATGRLTVVANDVDTYGRFGVPVVPDRWPDAAALGGIGTALTHAETDRAVIVACDLPFVTTALLEWLVALAPDAEVTIPVTEAEGTHPLCAVYARTCLPHIDSRVAAGRLKVIGFFADVRVRRVEETELRAAGFGPELLANLNTPQELASVESASASARSER